MFSKFVTRREFLNCGKLSLLFFLNSCSNLPNKVKIALQNSFYPESFKDTIPKDWKQEKINFENIRLQKNRNTIFNSDFTLINDGWISSIDFSEFEKINEYALFENLDKRSIDFLGSFNQNQRSKLFPIGVVPYTIIIKNNKELITSARTSWDFLLSEKLTGKIIFPHSPRIILSIAQKINSSNSLKKLKSQAMLFDDKNMLNWLINSDAIVAIVPYSLCSKYLKIDKRLSLVFPSQGVPLMWHFLLSRSNQNNEILIKWIKSLENKSIVDKLVSQGWYLPFNSDYLQSKYKSESLPISVPSEKCWENSWSFPVLSNEQKINFNFAIVNALSSSKIKEIFQKRGWLKLENIKDNNLLKFQYKFLEVNIYWNDFDKILLKSSCCISMAGTAAEQAIGLGKPVIQIEGKGPQFTKNFAEAQRRLLGKYVFCASNYKDKNDQINQTIKLIIKMIYLIQLNKKFMISCNENAKKRLGENKACLKMVDDMNIVIKNG